MRRYELIKRKRPADLVGPSNRQVKRLAAMVFEILDNNRVLTRCQIDQLRLLDRAVRPVVIDDDPASDLQP